MSLTTLCRLCITSSHEFKCLIEDNDRRNGVYEIAAKYFDPKLLRPDKEQTTAAICLECWRHINEFHTFQQSVINTQLEYTNSIKDFDKLDVQMDQPTLSTNVSTFNDSILSNCQNQELAQKTITAITAQLDAVQSTSQELIQKSIAVTTTTKESVKIDPTEKIHEMDSLIFKLIGQLGCTVCNEKFDYYATLREHFYNEHRNKECNVICCGRKYNQRFKLVRHIRRIHNAKDTYPYRCEICSRPFIEHSKLKTHHRHVHKLNVNYDFNCKLCGETFHQEAGLIRHTNRKHQKVEIIVEWFCNECNLLFSSFSSLEIHTKRKHIHINLANKFKDNSQPLLYCKLCNNMYKAVNYYLDHMNEYHSKVTIHSDLLSQLQLVQQLVEENQDIFIIDEIIPEEVYTSNTFNASLELRNDINRSPVDIVDVKHEDTAISLDDCSSN